MDVRQSRESERAQRKLALELIRRFGKDPSNYSLTRQYSTKLRDMIGNYKLDAIELANHPETLSAEWYLRLLCELQEVFSGSQRLFKRLFNPAYF